jgi:hypothetical protein
MFELSAVAVIVGLLVTTAVLDADSLMAVGALLAALGFLGSVAAGAVYHARLRAALGRVGALPPWWWLAPTRLHRRLEGDARRVVLAWFRVGVGGMAVHGGGIALFLIGAALALGAF